MSHTVTAGLHGKLTAREEEVMERFARFLIDQAFAVLNSQK